MIPTVVVGEDDRALASSVHYAVLPDPAFLYDCIECDRSSPYLACAVAVVVLNAAGELETDRHLLEAGIGEDWD